MKKYPKEMAKHVVNLRNQGKTYNEIAKEMKVSISYIVDVLSSAGLTTKLHNRKKKRKDKYDLPNHGRKCRCCGKSTGVNWWWCKTCHARLTRKK